MTTSFAKDSALGALAGAAATLASFVSGVIVARSLGAAGAGAVAYVVWLVTLLVPVFDLGSAAVVARFVPELRARNAPEEADRLAAHMMRRLCLSFAIIGVGGALVLHWQASPWFEVPVYLVAAILASFANAYLRGIRDFAKLAKTLIASALLQLCLVALGSFYFGVSGALWGYVLGQIMPAALAFRAGLRGQRPDPALLARAARYGRYAWMANIATACVWSRFEVFFLERYWGHAEVGQFVVALAVTSLATQGPMLLTVGVLPALAARYGRNEIDALHAETAMGTRMLAALVFPACLGMAAIASIVLPMLYGAAFGPAVPVAAALLCISAIGVTTLIATNFIQAAERSDFVLLSSGLGMILTFLAGFVLIPRWGLYGAILGRGTIQLVLVVVGMWFVTRRLHCPMPFASLARIFVSSMLCAGVAWVVVQLLPSPWSLCAAILLGGATYLLMMRWTRALPRSDLEKLEAVAARIYGPGARAVLAVLAILGGNKPSAAPTHKQAASPDAMEKEATT